MMTCIAMNNSNSYLRTKAKEKKTMMKLTMVTVSAISQFEGLEQEIRSGPTVTP